MGVSVSKRAVFIGNPKSTVDMLFWNLSNLCKAKIIQNEFLLKLKQVNSKYKQSILFAKLKRSSQVLKSCTGCMLLKCKVLKPVYDNRYLIFEICSRIEMFHIGII